MLAPCCPGQVASIRLDFGYSLYIVFASTSLIDCISVEVMTKLLWNSCDTTPRFELPTMLCIRIQKFIGQSKRSF